jgi:hypothetical protein
MQPNTVTEPAAKTISGNSHPCLVPIRMPFPYRRTRRNLPQQVLLLTIACIATSVPCRSSRGISGLQRRLILQTSPDSDADGG